jgi:hypothetical protein
METSETHGGTDAMIEQHAVASVNHPRQLVASGSEYYARDA